MFWLTTERDCICGATPTTATVFTNELNVNWNFPEMVSMSLDVGIGHGIPIVISSSTLEIVLPGTLLTSELIDTTDMILLFSNYK